MSDYQGNIVIKNPATPTGPAETGSAPGIWKLSEALAFKRQGVWPTPGIQAADPYFNYVSLLLSTTSLGNANNNLFVDSSGAFSPISRNGNTTQGSVTPYGVNWSNYMNGTNNRISSSNSAVLGFGTGSFTVEFWLYYTGGNGYKFFFVINPGVGNYIGYGLNTGSLTPWVWNNANVLIATSNITPNTWQHHAVVRNGSTLTIYLNGIAIGSTTWSVDLGSSATAFIGWNGGNDSQSTPGFISDYRVVKGSAVYTSNFTPPTSPLTAISGTSLLTCQSNRFVDASANSLPITVSGTVNTTEFAPFLTSTYTGISYNQSDITNWSGYFDGSGDYLYYGANSAFAFGTGSFTVEFFIYTSSATNQMVFDTIQPGISGGGSNRFYVYINTSQQVVVGPATNTLTSSSSIQLGTWNHVAVVRSGTTRTIYINGVSAASDTFSGDLTSGYATVGFDAASGGTIILNGYLSNLRAVKGTAVYTSAFTPPTTNLTAISGTSLLTLQNAAFTDNSTNNFIITINGNTTVTGNSPFNPVGYWSNYFDGSGDFLSAPSNAAFDLGSSSFTVECWFNANSFAAGFGLISRYNYTSVGLGWLITIQNSTTVRFVRGNDIILDCTVSAMSTGAWYHVAAVRNGSTLTVYLNGVQVGQATGISNFTDAATALQIGRTNTVTNDINGYISNARVVKGTAVYTAAFTPPTTPLTAITNTSLLTCQNGRFIDNSANALTITRNGDVSVQSFDPFYTSTIASNGGSMYFDGSGDYLAAPSSPNYALGTGDFIVEVWVYPTVQGGHGSGNNDCIIDFRPGTGGGAYGTLYSGGSGTRISWYANTTNVITGAAIPNNAWAHLVVSRVSGNTRLFINGVQSGSTYTDSTNYLQGPVWLGQFNDGIGAGWFQGYMSGMRIVKGSGVSSTFTPPTAPQTPTPNTTLLVNGMNAGAYDATAINNMETVGNAQVRYPTPFAPANYYAGAFDGTGDYLTVPSNAALNFGTGDFTWEGWIYANSLSNIPFIMHKSTGNGTGTGWFIEIGSGAVYVGPGTTGGSFATFSASSVTTNAWFHLAITRVGTTLNCFINGTSVGTATAAGYGSSYDNSAVFGIGGWNPVVSGYDLNGLISNLRVVKGTAVYTANFTPSTTPLTAISGTSLLTCQNTTFIDNSSNAFTITAFGNATAGAIGPFTATGGTSTYFDGSGDNLFMPSSPSMNCGTGNWTVEGWVCTFTRTTNYPLIFGNNRGSFTTDALAITASNADSSPSYLNKFVFAWGSSGFSSPSAGTSALLVSNVTNANGVWYHLAVVRNGTSVKMYRNGTEVASATVSAGATFNWGFNGSLAGGGNWDGAQGNWNGYLDDLRITNGVARYTANFTPPTQAFPPY